MKVSIIEYENNIAFEIFLIALSICDETNFKLLPFA